MANYDSDLNIHCYNITEEEFNKLSLEDVNYSGILFIFTEEYNKIVCNKIDELIDELNKIKNKDSEVKFISNNILEDMVIVHMIESYDSYDIYLEYE